MGAVGVLQGVSAAAIAVLFGEYQNFVRTLGSINWTAWGRHRHAEIQLRRVDGYMLVFLLAGIIAGILGLRAFFGAIVREYYILCNAFFFGLILMVAFLWLRKVNRWHAGTVIALLAGMGFSYLLTCIRPITTPDHPVMAMVTGVFAGTTFLLPGVSDAFIAVFFTKYRYILTSFGSLEYEVIIPFIAGSVFGGLAIAKVLARLLTAYYNPIVALLSGWMIGSLNRIWPWREVLEYTTTWEGDRIPAFDRSILPWQYLEVTGRDPHMLHAILIMASGVFIVVLIEKLATRLKTKH